MSEGREIDMRGVIPCLRILGHSRWNKPYFFMALIVLTLLFLMIIFFYWLQHCNTLGFEHLVSFLAMEYSSTKSIPSPFSFQGAGMLLLLPQPISILKWCKKPITQITLAKTRIELLGYGKKDMVQQRYTQYRCTESNVQETFFYFIHRCGITQKRSKTGKIQKNGLQWKRGKNKIKKKEDFLIRKEITLSLLLRIYDKGSKS